MVSPSPTWIIVTLLITEGVRRTPPMTSQRGGGAKSQWRMPGHVSQKCLLYWGELPVCGRGPAYLSNAAPNTFHVLLSSMPLGGVIICAMDTMNCTSQLAAPYLLQMEKFLLLFFFKGGLHERRCQLVTTPASMDIVLCAACLIE